MCTLGSEITLLNSFIRFAVLAFEASQLSPQHTHTQCQAEMEWSMEWSVVQTQEYLH